MLVIVVVLPHWRIFIHCILTLFPTLLWSITRFTFSGIYPLCIFSPVHDRVICKIFILAFLGFSFYCKCYGFSPCTSFTNVGTFVTQIGAGSHHPGSFSMFAVIELSLPAGTWSWTADFIVLRLLFYHLC